MELAVFHRFFSRNVHPTFTLDFHSRKLGRVSSNSKGKILGKVFLKP
jgi:hypothetical protein